MSSNLCYCALCGCQSSPEKTGKTIKIEESGKGTILLPVCAICSKTYQKFLEQLVKRNLLCNNQVVEYNKMIRGDIL